MSLAILLIPYIAIVIGILVFAVINVLHIIFHAETTKFNTLVSMLFFVGLTTILIWSSILLMSFEWSTSLFGASPIPIEETFFE